MTELNIVFEASDEFVAENIPMPRPASLCLPEWYKQMPIQENGIKSFSSGGRMNTTVKACMPVLDAMTAGYIQETWCDVHVSVVNGQVEYVSSGKPSPVVVRVAKGTLARREHRYHKFELVWQNPYQPHTPRGTSCLITHPINRVDLPFRVSEGIMDTDAGMFIPFGKVPLFLDSDFEGVIPAGTPMFQIIPFKRDSWQSSMMIRSEEERNKEHRKITKYLTGAYRRIYRTSKEWK